MDKMTELLADLINYIYEFSTNEGTSDDLALIINQCIKIADCQREIESKLNDIHDQSEDFLVNLLKGDGEVEASK